MLQMAFTSQSDCDTTSEGLSATFAESGDSIKYTFYSESEGQIAEIVCLDKNGGNIETADTLKCTNASVVINHNVYSLQVPVNVFVSDSSGVTILEMDWCIVPLNGQSVFCRMDFIQH
jgi:hypothetical protein